jgi:hypothetical protein
MPLYYFHIYQHGSMIRDEEGSICTDLADAKREAADSAADLARQALARGESVDELCVEIHDAQERVLAGLSIGEVLSHPNDPAFEASCGVGEKEQKDRLH